MNRKITEEELKNSCYSLLDELFENIFELDFEHHTIRCRKTSRHLERNSLLSVRMNLEDAVNFLTENIIAPRDAEKIRSLLLNASNCKCDHSSVEFSILDSQGEEHKYIGKMLCTACWCWFCANSVESVLKWNPGYDIKEISNHRVTISTFGFFEVYVDNKAVLFRSKKAKELLALLVDRKGSYVSSSEAVGYLWEDETANGTTLSRIRKVAMRLNSTLAEYGIEDIIENVDGQRRIVPEKVDCDLYKYLSDRGRYANLFTGSYMLNYSWVEITLARLEQQNIQ